MKNLIGMKRLTRNQLIAINAGGRNSCIRKYQRQIIKANELNMTDSAREGVIGIILGEMENC